MICQVIRNKKNEIEKILAPNGKDSILYKDLLKITNIKEDAYKLWTKVYTPTFKSWFGDWLDNPQSVKNLDENGEPKLEGTYYVNNAGETHSVLTNQDTIKPNEVGYMLRAINILQSDKGIDIFSKGTKNNWSLDKILTELQIPKEQKQLILDIHWNILNKARVGIIGDIREEIITDLLANYSYSVEINTAKEGIGEHKLSPHNFYDNFSQYKKDGKYYMSYADQDGKTGEYSQIEKEITKQEFEANEGSPTQYYANLSAPGGTRGKSKYEANPDWEYHELEFKTPAITPSIKGHAQFATDNGIGWVRVWYNKKTGVVEIQEVQSDLFQKGRDKNNLTTIEKLSDYNYTTAESFEEIAELEKEGWERDGTSEDGMPFYKKAKTELEKRKDKEKLESPNQFLQLLNKDNNWVTFFIKSIIQDSAKKGYKKVLFPSGDTASKVEGHTTLEEFKKQKEDRIRGLQEAVIVKQDKEVWNEELGVNEIFPYIVKFNDRGTKFELPYKTKEEAQKLIDSKETEINQLKQELERVETEGFGALRKIWGFYENTVTNILKKQGFNPVKITDEYGNSWNEVTITEDSKRTILMNKTENPYINDKIKAGERIDKIFDGSALPTSYATIIESLINNGYIDEELIPIARALAKKDVNIIFRNTFEKSEQSAYMYYSTDFIGDDYIVLGLDRLGALSDKIFGRSIVHEMLHHYTIKALHSPESEREIQFEENINRLYQLAKKRLPSEYHYGLENTFEFVSEIISNPVFQNALTKDKSNLFDKFLEFVYRLFGGTYLSGKEIAKESVERILMFVREENLLLGTQKLSKGNRFKAPMKLANKPYIVSSSKVSVETVIDKIKDTIEVQEKIYSERRKGLAFTERLRNLKEVVKQENALKTFKTMVSEAGYWLEALEKRMTIIKEMVGNKDSLSSSDITETLTMLDELKNFASAYTILDDIQDVIANNPEMADTFNEANNLIGKRNVLMRDYLQMSLDALTDWVYPYVERANASLREQGKGELQLSKEDIRDRFLNAPKDIGYLNNLLGAAINSSDEINSLIAMAIKAELEKARMKDIQTKNDILREYIKLSGDKNNPKEFNKNYYRLITLPDGSKNYAFQQEIDEDRYELELEKFRKALGDKPDRSDIFAYRTYVKNLSKWFNVNTEVIPNVKEYLESKRIEFGENEYKSFLNNNLISVYADYANPEFIHSKDPNDPDKVLIYSNSLVRPRKSVYGNKNFDKLMQDPYYKLLYTTYKEANEKLPPKQRLKYGIIPQIQKSGFDGLLDNGLDLTKHLDRVKDSLKNIGSRKDENGDPLIDTQYGRSIQSLSGETVNYLPIYYNKIYDNHNEVSLDLLTSTLLFSQMANNFDATHEIMPHVNTLSAVVLGSNVVPGSGRKVTKTNSLGQIVNAITKKPIVKEGADRVNDRLRQFIDSAFWGQEYIPWEANLFGYQINVDKIIDKFGFLNALSTMTLNIAGGMNNTLIANYNALNEATAGKYFSKKDWLAGKWEYSKCVTDLIADSTKVVNKSKLSQLVELYDAIQGEFRDHYGRRISGNAAKRGFNTSSLFFINNITEHEAQISCFIGYLKATKIKDKSGKEIDLYDAYEVKNGLLKLKDNVQFSETQRLDVMNKLHGINKEMHGNYNKFDKSTLQRHALGRLALMFRKHIYTGYQRRWATGYVDFEQGSYREGYYKSFGKALIRELKDKKFGLITDWSGLSAAERAAFRQSSLDLMTLVFVMVMFGLLDDDELKNNSALQNHAMLQLRRVQADLLFYTFIHPDVIRLMKTPAVTMDYLGKVIDWLDQAFFTWDEEQLYYKKREGRHEKGDSKAWAKFEKLAPGLRGLTVFENPEDQLTVFNE